MIERVRRTGFSVTPARNEPPAPAKPGLTVFDDYPLADLVELIDWTPFFNAWELAGRYPAILDDAVVGSQARDLFADAQAMLARIVGEKWLAAKAVVGLWPANSHGDDVVLEADAAPVTLHFLRQQVDKPVERPDFCLADFIAPASSGRQDWIGAFAVTAGIGIEPHVARFQADHDDYNAIMLKALADRLAETLAERVHQHVRKELWGYAVGESLPAAAVSGYYFSHPQGQYFVVGRVSREQAADYAQRKGITLAQAERLLASNLDYDPE